MFVPKYVTYLTVQATNGQIHAAVSLHQMGETDQPKGGAGWGLGVSEKSDFGGFTLFN